MSIIKLEILKYLPDSKTDLAPLLFVHGANHGAWCWEEHFLPFFKSKGFPSYALSFRGHGKSEGKEDLHAFSLNDYVEDVLNTISSLHIKPVLIGHSMGGVVIQKILEMHPEKIHGIVLISSVPPKGMVKDFIRLLFIKSKKFYKLMLFNSGKTQEFPIDLFLSTEISEDKKRHYSKLLTPESSNASKECLKPFVKQKISCKVPRLILGSKKDQMISEKTTLSVGNYYKTQPYIFENMSHDMMLQSSWKMVAEQIVAFLQKSIK